MLIGNVSIEVHTLYTMQAGVRQLSSQCSSTLFSTGEKMKKKTRRPTEGSHSPLSVTEHFSLPDTLTNHLSVYLIVCVSVCLLNCLPVCVCQAPSHPTLSLSLSLSTEFDNHRAAVSGCHSEVAVETSGAKLESFLRASGVTQP